MTLEKEEQDKEFIERIYVEYFPIMYNCAYHYLKDDDKARDIVHNSICKLYSKAAKLKSFDEHYLISYIMLTVKHLSLDFLKSSQNKKHFSYYDEMETEFDEVFNPERLVVESEDYHALVDRIKNLPEKKKNLLYMKYILEMDVPEISNATGTSVSTLHVIFHRIKKELLKEV